MTDKRLPDNTCPLCGSGDIYGCAMDPDPDKIFNVFRCNHCMSVWEIQLQTIIKDYTVLVDNSDLVPAVDHTAQIEINKNIRDQ